MIKLYGTPPTRALRVIWLLNELGLEYELLPVDILKGECRREDFLALNPAAKVPVLVDGDLVLTESAAIEAQLLDGAPKLREYLKSMYARPTAPMTIAEAFAAMDS
ncbi:glutathione S-transferase N-terminal domain-containing protein [Microbulbifer rhizosphaerae]|uniref:GST N-terminal domain-containing protein n=1 Tax=Microbulbifer rhizosphaerae TaxID=1562603 RepID=A0A7W4WDB6_9GAMM|nr:glutathione S-transferase N-terminal domain-containing protein [Microbulbifer rhizosphaerae]MBB3062133.1 hypothetical protein [Microbulbifer rhizosphaerae]